MECTLRQQCLTVNPFDMERGSPTVKKPTETDLKCVDSLSQYGFALLEKQSYEEALVSFNRAIQVQPNSYAAWYGQGDALANLKRYQEALSSFNRAIEIVPDKPEAWTFRGVVLIHLERYQEALESCDRALALKPDDQEAWTFRGVALQRLGRFQEAYASYHNATATQQLSWWQKLLQVVKQLLHRLQRKPKGRVIRSLTDKF